MIPFFFLLLFLFNFSSHFFTCRQIVFDGLSTENELEIHTDNFFLPTQSFLSWCWNPTPGWDLISDEDDQIIWIQIYISSHFLFLSSFLCLSSLSKIVKFLQSNVKLAENSFWFHLCWNVFHFIRLIWSTFLWEEGKVKQTNVVSHFKRLTPFVQKTIFISSLPSWIIFDGDQKSGELLNHRPHYCFCYSRVTTSCNEREREG